ncbi:MAG: hypothetical protein MJA84_04540, partial [Firmicutes bacterium]|nr:hypothetical protein [Bacillota bacterium]
MNIDKSILKSLVLLILLVFSCENDSTNITSPSANNSNTTVPEGYIKIKANISSELKMNGLNVLGVGDSTIVENDSFEILHFDVKDFGFLYFFDDLGRVIALVLIDNSSENIVVSADKIAEAFIYFNPDIHLSNLKITEQIINNVKSGSTYSDFVSAVEQSINSRIPLEDINNEIFDHFIISIAEEVSRLENVGGRNQHDFDENLTIDVGENNGIEIFNGNVINIGINVIDETIQGDMESEIVSTLLVKPQKLEATPRLEDNCYLIYATSGDILSPNPADAQATRENLLFFSTSILKIAFGLVFTAVDGDCWKDFEENYVSAYLDLIKSGFSGEKPTFGFFLDRFIDTWDGFIKDIVL